MCVCVCVCVCVCSSALHSHFLDSNLGVTELFSHYQLVWPVNIFIGTDLRNYFRGSSLEKRSGNTGLLNMKE